MSFPTFYNPEHVGKLVPPRITEAIEAGHKAKQSPSDDDEHRVLMLLVDTQVDFVHEDGALSVPGAVADTRQTIEWIYRNIASVTHIAASLDSHVPQQIFFPMWWGDTDGNPPPPFTVITADDVGNGKWNPLVEESWSKEYVKRLEKHAKKTLMIWPYHTLIGTPGHTLTPALYEAIAFHSSSRQAQPIFLSKGSIPKTEHYSIMEPEVKVLEEPLGGLNTDFLDLIASYDEIYVAGQAKSHCVLETLTSMMNYYANSPATISKIRVLSDCTSSVVHPEIDFDAIANQTLIEYEAQGLTLVSSTELLPIR